MATKRHIEKDNNAILEEVISTLDMALSEKDVYELTVIDEDGERIEYKTRIEYMEFMINCARDELYEHNYFYQKDGIDKYSLGE